MRDKSIKETLGVACSSLVLGAVCYIYLWQTENMAVFISGLLEVRLDRSITN